MPSQGLNTSSRMASRAATGTRFGPVSGLTGDKMGLLSCRYTGSSGTNWVLTCVPRPQQSSRPQVALGDLMMVRRSLLVFALALSVARCADQPTAVKDPAGPQFLKWSGATP